MKRYCQNKLRPKEFEECDEGVWVKYSDARVIIQEACELLHSALEFGNGGEIDYDKICAFVNKYDKDISCAL